MTYFEIDNLNVNKLKKVIGRFAESHNFEDRGSDENTIAYYEDSDNENVNFLVMNYFKSGCLYAAFYSYKTKHVPEAMSLHPLLIAALEESFSDDLTIHGEEGCGKTDL